MYQFSLPHLYIALYRVGRMYFLNLGVKGLKRSPIGAQVSRCQVQSPSASSCL